MADSGGQARSNGVPSIEFESPVFNVFGLICGNLRMLYTGLAWEEGPGAS